MTRDIRGQVILPEIGQSLRGKNNLKERICSRSVLYYQCLLVPSFTTSLFGLFILLQFITPVCQLGFPCGLAGKESACNAGDLGSIPGLGRFPGEGKGYPLQ